MSWIEDYSALREDIHTGYIYEAIEAILYMRAHEEIPAEEQWHFSEMMGMCCRALADTEGAPPTWRRVCGRVVMSGW